MRRWDRWRSLVPAAVCSALTFAVYVLTAAPGLVWGDGIELAAVCATLGIAHPTGYPLFTLLGHVFTWLPVGEIPFRVTLFCALCVALSVGCMERLLWHLMGCSLSNTLAGPWRRAASVSGALAFGCCLGPWTHATRTEVYGLQLLIQSMGILMAWRLLEVKRTERAPSALPMSFLLGLGLSHHLLSLVLAPFWVHALRRDVGWTRGRRLLRRLVPHGAALLLGLLPILYLPLRAQQLPEVSWGHPADFEGLWWTLSGGDFTGTLLLTDSDGVHFTPAGLLEHGLMRGRSLAFYLLGMVSPSTGLPAFFLLLALGVGALCLGRGAVLTWRLQRDLSIPWMLGLVLYLGVLLGYNIGDITDYQLGFFALLWPLAWWGVWDLVTSSLRQAPLRLPEPARWILQVALLLLPLALVVGNYRAADRSQEGWVDTLAERLLRDLPTDAILLTDGGFTTATAWYQQAVQGQRRDILVFSLDFFYDPWYGVYWQRRDLGGRTLNIAETGGEFGESFIEALDRRIVAPNPGIPILIMPSPQQARALTRRFRLRQAVALMDADEIATFERRGVPAPQPLIFQLDRRQMRPEPARDRSGSRAGPASRFPVEQSVPPAADIPPHRPGGETDR